jgi:hypothetical protein
MSSVFQRVYYILYTIDLKKLAHNVPAVYDGLPARIRACVARPGLVNCGCSEPWEWSEAE